MNEKEKNLATSITDALNGSFDNKAFCNQMSKEHRTLQSYFTTLCLDWFKKQKEMYELDYYDGRNEHACRTGKVLIDYLEDGGLSYSKASRAIKCLVDNGIEADEAETVLQALCYILMDAEAENYFRR